MTCVCVNCLELDGDDVSFIIRSVLSEFPISRVDIFLPDWLDALPPEHPTRAAIFASVRESCEPVRRLRDAQRVASGISACEYVSRVGAAETDPGSGVVSIRVELPGELFYRIISERSGFAVSCDADLLELLTDMAGVKAEYDRVRGALEDVRTKGYGIVMPSREELRLEEPEIVRRAGRYGVTLKASAPSIHMLMANVETEVSPAIGSEKQSEGIISYLLQEFEGDTGKIWESNIFGKSLYDIASEGLQAKIKKMPAEAQTKLQETLQRVVTEGSGGLICIIL